MFMQSVALILHEESVLAYGFHSLFAIEQVAQSLGHNVIIANGDRHAADAIEALMLERKVDGLILPPSIVKPSLIKKIGDFPYVVLGQPDSAKQDASLVDNNNVQGAEMAAQHLLSKGYQRVAYIGGMQRAGFVKRHVNGYRNALPKGCEPTVFPTNGTPEDAYRVAAALLTGTNAPDAVLCNDNLVAFGLLRVCKEYGLGVPAQVGVVTFDNYPLAEYTDPSLTCVDIDTALLGEKTARLLFTRIERRTINQQILLSASIIERESSDRM